MIVRKIRPEELKRTEELSAHAFEFRMSDAEKSAEEFAQERMNHPQAAQDVNWREHWAAFLDDDKTMTSTFIAIPYRMHFDGHDTLMMGIGGVSTLPQYRRSGGVRGCFESALPDMYAQGAAFSYLYPFSTAFYRKFGYELGCERNDYKFKLAGMPRVETGGCCDLLEPGKEGFREAIRVIDAVWQRRFNCMVIDGEIEYQWIDKANPFRDAEYTYVYRSVQGNPKGYMTYESDKSGETVKCRRFVFVDIEGFYGLMNLLHTLASDRAYITMTLPVDVELGAILPEWSQGVVECARRQAGMVRVVNVVQVLKKARMRGTGELVIGVTDGQIAPNNGRFAVRFENDVTTDVALTDAPCDIELTVQEFSRLICGRSDLRAAAYLPDVKLHCELARAEKVFYKKPMYISRHF